MFKLEARRKYQGEPLYFGAMISDGAWVCPPQRPYWRFSLVLGWGSVSLTAYRMSEPAWTNFKRTAGMA